MGKKPKIRYTLSNVDNVSPLSEYEINAILRAADEIIFSGGRTMLAKILKGSKDKKIIEKDLQKCPAYGAFHNCTIDEITAKIDWIIVHGYLRIEYDYRLPLIVFTDKGWETYKPIYVEELYAVMVIAEVEDYPSVIERLKTTNRQVVTMLLDKIATSKNLKLIDLLTNWKTNEVKKVKAMITSTLEKLETN